MKIEIKHLIKKYGTKKALDGVDMELSQGIYGLLGPNGAGKSTLINILVGNLSPTAGEVLCGGKRINDMGRAYRRLLGYMPQQQTLYPFFSGREFLNYMAVLKEVPKEFIRERVEEVAAMVNLSDELEKRLLAYSGGMKQRILLAAAVLGDPAILILDEPTAGLDPRERIRIRNLISTIAADKIVLIATHVVQDIECISKEVILMDHGKVIRKNTIAHLTEEVRPFVYAVHAPQEMIADMEKKYRVSSILSDGQMAQIRLLSEQRPEGLSCEVVMPGLEDVYLYHFGRTEEEGWYS